MAARSAVQDEVSDEAEMDRLLDEMCDGSGGRHDWESNRPEPNAPKMHPGLRKRMDSGEVFDVATAKWV